MITLTPYRKDYHAVANQGCLLTAIYAYGDLPPRYPVPAIQYRAHYSTWLNTKGIQRFGIVIRELMSSGICPAVWIWIKD